MRLPGDRATCEPTLVSTGPRPLRTIATAVPRPSVGLCCGFGLAIFNYSFLLRRATSAYPWASPFLTTTVLLNLIFLRYAVQLKRELAYPVISINSSPAMPIMKISTCWIGTKVEDFLDENYNTELNYPEHAR